MEKKKKKQGQSVKSGNSEIIGQLQDAFGIESPMKEVRLKTEVIRIDNHNAARVVQIKDPPEEQLVYSKYKDAYTVKSLIDNLLAQKDTKAKDAALKLRSIIVEASKNNDTERINNIISTCKVLEGKVYSLTPGSAQSGLTYFFIIEEINKLEQT